MTGPSSKVLFVAPVEPWCRENGSSLIIADLLESLAGRGDADLLAVFVRRQELASGGIAPAHLENVLLDIPGLPRWRSVLRAAARGSSPLRHRFDNSRVAARILQVLGEYAFQADLVHVEHLPLVDLGLNVAHSLRIPLVYRAHNIESRLWARRLQGPASLKAPIVRHMERTEIDAVRSADLTLCISPGDLEWIQERAPTARSGLLPCTLRLDRYDRVAPADRIYERQICFVGGLDWAPNEDGLHWFVSHVLPSIVRARPDAGLVVLSRGAEQRDWLAGNPSVTILPAAASAPALFAASHVSVAPLFQGGGVRIKIPESLALGCPVVATTVGAEGHDLPNLAKSDEAGEFGSACLRALASPDGTGGRARMRAELEALYGAEGGALRLIDHWRAAIGSSVTAARS